METVLRGIHHAVLDARLQELYVTPGILLRFLLNLRRLPNFRPGQLYTAYLLGCLQTIRPRVVVTFVDNSEYFQSLTRLYPSAAFFAVQNGFRSEVSISPSSRMPGGWLPPRPEPGSVMTLPHFFCFGSYETDLYLRCGHEVERFEAIGSLRAGYYKSEIAGPAAKISHELCLVSEWDAAIMIGRIYPNIRLGVDRLNDHLRRYVEETGASLVIAGRSRDPRERDTYEALFGGRAVFIENAPADFSTYRAMDSANLVISLYSTAAFEAFGWGKKTIFCNFSGDETLSCPRPGPWSVGDVDYGRFKEAVDRFRRISVSEYAALAGEAARFMMQYDSARPAHRVIRERLLEALEKKPA